MPFLYATLRYFKCICICAWFHTAPYTFPAENTRVCVCDVHLTNAYLLTNVHLNLKDLTSKS